MRNMVLLMLFAAVAVCVARGGETVGEFGSHPSGWENRRVAFIGDSITDPQQTQGQNVYWQYLAKWLNLDAHVFAACGHRWLEMPEHIRKMSSDMGTDVDAVVMLMGTNDYAEGVPLGEWHNLETGDVNWWGKTRKLDRRVPNMDTNTFCGRVNKALSMLKKGWPEAQIIVLTPLKRGYFKCAEDNVQPSEEWPNVSGLRLEDYVRAIKEGASLWSCPVIDLFAESGFTPTLPDDYAKFCRSRENDMLHPNSDGHRRLAELLYFRLRQLPPSFRERRQVQTGDYVLADGWSFRREGESEFRLVRVPHDWGVDYGFLRAGSCPSQGDLPYEGKGLYRRGLDGFSPPPGGRTYLTLDGVQCRSVVRLNGKVVGGRPYGYASETIDITGALTPTGNVLEVEAENVAGSSRWYPGSGIFRDVTVSVCGRDHVHPNTLFIRTLSADSSLARIAVSFEWRGGVSNFTFSVENPRLWSPEHPNVYELELFGRKYRYGIRTAEFDPQRGFFLNGAHRQMRGVCLHHDLGPLGAAFDKDAARRQLALLKEMGCDAIRTTHNPPASAFLDLCDEMGFLVLDEAFDMWEIPKGDYSRFWKDWHERDLRDFVCRDRSHPSVVMWSIGNELGEHAEADPSNAVRIATELSAIVKACDPTRPVSFGCWQHAPMTNGCQRTVDAFGANYLPFRYGQFLLDNPGVGLFGSETCSTVSSRGEYYFPVVATPIKDETDLVRRHAEGVKEMVRGAQVSGYDLWGAHENDYPPDVEFAFQEDNPAVYGEFVWTGFDYLGEPSPCERAGGRSSYFGIFDLAGFPKDRYWLYKSHWRPDVPTAHILPHWTWPGREGAVTPVHVYTSGDEAELFVNGHSQGRQRRAPRQYRFRWDGVRYEPGEICVKTWRNGVPWAEDCVRTAGAPVAVEKSVCRFGNLSFATFSLVDANGTVCPNSDMELTVAADANSRIVALCNGDASSHEDLHGRSMRTFHGLLLAVVEGDASGVRGVTDSLGDECGAEATCDAGAAFRGNRPETWFHIIGGNASKEGLAADIAAIAEAGLGGIQLFHGHSDAGLWPGVTNPVPCMSAQWIDLVKFAETECHRRGLSFKMQNCPGWSMSGGPWITPNTAMRRLVAFPPGERPRFDSDDDYHEIGAVTFPMPDSSNDHELLRVFKNPQQLDHAWAYEPKTNLWGRPCPPGAWHDVMPMTFARPGASRLDMWEAKAGWGLRRFTMSADSTPVRTNGVGNLVFGHVNAKSRNHPAPPEATGWECDKMSPEGFEANWRGYIGKIAAAGVRLDGILIDSWECGAQTWTWKMEEEFERRNGYALRQWLPALFGYVLGSEADTEKFLLDWRNTCSRMIEENYFGTIARLAHANGITAQFESAFGDVIVGDILRYWKYADEPMCEFWSPFDNAKGFVGSHDFKPVLPCVSAAHVYGKRRVSAEALTSFNLTFDENFREWKRNIDRHYGRGVTHIVLHTYTHNPVVGGKPPSTSFGGRIGSPFLREQPWWSYMRDFTDYIAFCGNELERGVPAVDVLMYLGDDVNHKPSESTLLFDNQYKYDYINHDALVSRLAVRDGKLVLPEGTSYRVLWMPEGTFVSDATERRIEELSSCGARIVRGRFAPDWPSPIRSVGYDGRCVDWYQRHDRDEDVFFVAFADGTSRFVFRRGGRTWAVNPLTRREIPVVGGRPCAGEKRIFLAPAEDYPPDAVVRVYRGTFEHDGVNGAVLDLGRVRDWATVKVNGRTAGRLWCAPYACDIADMTKPGKNVIEVEVTSTIYNKLVSDAGKSEADRTTWTMCGPSADAKYADAGLYGPVRLRFLQ